MSRSHAWACMRVGDWGGGARAEFCGRLPAGATLCYNNLSSLLQRARSCPVIFEEFAPDTAQELVRLRALRGRVLALVTAGGGLCALLQFALMV